MDPPLQWISLPKKKYGSVNVQVNVTKISPGPSTENIPHDAIDELSEFFSSLFMNRVREGVPFKSLSPMGEEVKETIMPVQKCGPVKTKSRDIEVFENPLLKVNPQDIFNKLNASLSFLLTTKEVMTTLLKESINCDGSFVIQAEIDKTKPFWQNLTSIDPVRFSLNALKLAFHSIDKHSQLSELAAMNKEVLQSIYDNPSYNPNDILMGASLELIHFVQKNPQIVKGFINILMNAHKDEEISQLIKNKDLFSALIKDPSLRDLVGKKDVFPLEMGDSQEARNAQILFIQAELQDEIDTILIFKNLIFPKGTISSYHHNQAANARQYFEYMLELFPNHDDVMSKITSWIEETPANPRCDTLKTWKNFRSVLQEDYRAILKASPTLFEQPKGVAKKKIAKIYEKKTTEINLYRLQLHKVRETAQKIATQLTLNILQSAEPVPSARKNSAYVGCVHLLEVLENKEWLIEDLFQTLKQEMPGLLTKRKELGLPSHSFFLEPFFEELKKSLHLPDTEISDVISLVGEINLPETDNILQHHSSKKTPYKSKKKKRKNKGYNQIQSTNANQKDGAPQNDSTMVIAPLNARPSPDESQEEKETELVTASVSQIEVPQIGIERTPIIGIPSIEMEKEIEFGNDYFKNLHVHYQKLKNNQKNPPVGEAVVLLTDYESKLYTYLMGNVFNNNNRPSWSELVQDLAGLGFQGKPNTVGNGSTWVFFVNEKNGLFFNDENYRYATFNVHSIHGKKGNEPIPIPFLRFFQSGFGHIFGLTKEIVEARLQQHSLSR